MYTTDTESNSARKLLITGLLLAMFFSSLDNTVVGTAVPRIVGEFGGLSQMTWLTTAYMLASVAIVPITGKLADRIGRKTIYMTGLILFMIGSMLCGMAQSMTQLILFRGFQGIGGGIMMPMAMIVIGDLFTGEQRAKWQGVIGSVFGLSSIIGPQVGGWLVDSLNWRWVFYINLPFGILATVFIALGLKHHQKNPISAPMDLLGSFTMVVSVTSLLLALTLGGNEFEWNSWQIIGLFMSFIVFMIAFIRTEQKAKDPILPLHLFKNRAFVLLNGVGFFMSVGMFGSILFVPLFMQGIIGISPTASGTVMLPMMFAMMFTSLLGGFLVRKVGVKIQMIAGMLLIGIGFYLLSLMGTDTTKFIAMRNIVVIGLGTGFVMPIITLALQERFSKAEMGVVTSSSQFFRQIGGVFGTAVLGTVMNHYSTNLLSEKLLPLFKTLSSQYQQMMFPIQKMVQETPQALYSMLLTKEGKSVVSMPEALQGQFVIIVKEALVNSLNHVFLFSIIFGILGFCLALFLPNIKITGAKKAEREES